MKKLFSLAIVICAFSTAHAQTSFSNPNEGIAVPILKLSSGNGGMLGSGGTIEFYKGAEAHPMGRIYTSNMYSAGVGNSQGKLTLSSYYNAYKDELTLYNGNVGIGTATPLAKLHINAGTDKNIFFRPASDFGAGVSGMGIQSVNNANSLYMPLEIEGSALLLNAATKGRVGIGTANPQGALDVDGSNENGWSYFRANAQRYNPSGAINYGLIIGWNQSAGQGETQI